MAYYYFDPTIYWEAPTISTKICFITPRLPPAIDGLGDYCRQLWGHWSNESGTSVKPPWQFLVLEGARETASLWSDVQVESFERNKSSLIRALDRAGCQVCVLQYVGYGYDNRGIPNWLVEALQAWTSKGGKLVTMFHETWAEGFPWQSVFWHTSAQKNCASKVLDLSSVAVTSNTATLADLKSLGQSRAISLIPIGCSFDTTEASNLLWNQMLVIGKQPSRLRALRVHKKLISTLLRSKILSKIVLAGQAENGSDEESRQLIESLDGAVEIVEAYNFKAESLPMSVRQSGISLMHTQTTCLLKSTSFQLAAQLGQVPITRQEKDPGPPIVPGSHYLDYDSSTARQLLKKLSNPDELIAVSKAVSELGHTYLSWTSIVRQWRQILEGDRSN